MYSIIRLVVRKKFLSDPLILYICINVIKGHTDMDNLPPPPHKLMIRTTLKNMNFFTILEFYIYLIPITKFEAHSIHIMDSDITPHFYYIYKVITFIQLLIYYNLIYLFLFSKVLIFIR